MNLMKSQMLTKKQAAEIIKSEFKLNQTYFNVLYFLLILMIFFSLILRESAFIFNLMISIAQAFVFYLIFKSTKERINQLEEKYSQEN